MRGAVEGRFQAKLPFDCAGEHSAQGLHRKIIILRSIEDKWTRRLNINIDGFNVKLISVNDLGVRAVAAWTEQILVGGKILLVTIQAE